MPLEHSVIVKKRGKELPIYRQIAHYLKKQIDTEVIRVGERLPSMSQMVKEWDVNYPTVKTALELLVKDGVIHCEPGRGKGPLVVKSDKIGKKCSLA